MKAQEIEVGKEYKVRISAFEYANYAVHQTGVSRFAREANNTIQVKVLEKGLERDYTPSERKDGILVSVTDEEVIGRFQEYGKPVGGEELQGIISARSFETSVEQEEAERQQRIQEHEANEQKWERQMAAIAEPIDPADLGRIIWQQGHDTGHAVKDALSHLRDLAKSATQLADRIEDGTERDYERVMNGPAPKGHQYPRLFQGGRHLGDRCLRTIQAVEDYAASTSQYNTFQALRGNIDKD